MTLDEVKKIIDDDLNGELQIAAHQLGMWVNALPPEETSDPWPGEIACIVYDSPWALTHDTIGATFSKRYVQELIHNMIGVHNLRHRTAQVEMMGDEAHDATRRGVAPVATS